jgi:hypothetical protein
MYIQFHPTTNQITPIYFYFFDIRRWNFQNRFQLSGGNVNDDDDDESR